MYIITDFFAAAYLLHQNFWSKYEWIQLHPSILLKSTTLCQKTKIITFNLRVYLYIYISEFCDIPFVILSEAIWNWLLIQHTKKRPRISRPLFMFISIKSKQVSKNTTIITFIEETLQHINSDFLMPINLTNNFIEKDLLFYYFLLYILLYY